MAEEKNEIKSKERWVVAEVATQTTPMVVDTQTKQPYDDAAWKADISNKIDKLLKLLD